MAAHREKIAHLHRLADAERGVFKLNKKRCLTREGFKNRLIHPAHLLADLLSDNGTVKARRGGHGRKRADNCIEFGGTGGSVLPGLRGCSHIERQLGQFKRFIQCVTVRLGGKNAHLGVCLLPGFAAKGGCPVCLSGRQVGRLHDGGVLLIHQQFECREGGIPHGIRHSILDTALLDADIHDAAGIIRQRQITVGLNKQQCKDRDTGFPVGSKVFDDFGH